MMKSTKPACFSPAWSRSMASQRPRPSGETVRNSSAQRAVNGLGTLASFHSRNWKPFLKSSKTGSPATIEGLHGQTFLRSSHLLLSQKPMPHTPCSRLLCQSLIGVKNSAGKLASLPARQLKPSLQAAPASSKKGQAVNEQRLQQQRAQTAAKDYITGVGMRQEMLELTDRMLAKKFEVSSYVIKRTRAHAQVTALTEDEQQLVRQCAREHDRLEQRLIYFTKPYLSNHHQVPVCAIDRELERLGFKNPLNRKAGTTEITA